VELRSTNHKFLETILHVPVGFISVEDKIKKEVEAQLNRGRVTCVVTIVGSQHSEVFVNKRLVAKYLQRIGELKKEFKLSANPSLDTILHLPGALSLVEHAVPSSRLWPRIKGLVQQTAGELVRVREHEGKALVSYVRHKAVGLKANLALVKQRYHKAVKSRASQINSDDARSAFLKDADITEEVERLAFHVDNLLTKLTLSSPIGKELDFVAQEMQREANTMGAKSCDTGVSAVVVEMKSQIEKIREQVQNIE
jgi:uncharacterized protein (TIGR00255 family)